jgi:hypothetical protein
MRWLVFFEDSHRIRLPLNLEWRSLQVRDLGFLPVIGKVDVSV